MSKTEYKRLGDYIREVNARNREHRAIQAYAFGDGLVDESNYPRSIYIVLIFCTEYDKIDVSTI